jgi:hypothetical protein
MALTRVLITVKTYPTLSTKYEELVCTAGFLENGQWIRIYPVQYRKKSYAEQYKKYQWIEIDLVKNTEDFRPESFRPVSHDTEISIIDTIESDRGSWDARRKFVLNKVYTNLEQLIAESKNKSMYTSLAVFKPTEIVDFKIKPVEREWDTEKLMALNQLNIFENVMTERPRVVKKLPYEFSYVFRDDKGKESKLMIEDWETGQLYWNCFYEHKSEEIACQKVKEKYFNDFAKTKDLHFFLGTAKTFQLRAPNPFLIIGTFHPKFSKNLAKQGELF